MEKVISLIFFPQMKCYASICSFFFKFLEADALVSAATDTCAWFGVCEEDVILVGFAQVPPAPSERSQGTSGNLTGKGR